MRPHWLPVVGCLCLLVSSALTAAVPTPDTMVVARSEDGDPVSTYLLLEESDNCAVKQCCCYETMSTK